MEGVGLGVVGGVGLGVDFDLVKAAAHVLGVMDLDPGPPEEAGLRVPVL